MSFITNASVIYASCIWPQQTSCVWPQQTSCIWPQQTSCKLPDVRGVRTPCRGGVWDGVRDGGCGTGCGTGVLGPIKEHPCVSYDLDDNYLLIILNYFLLYLIPNEFTFPMHTLAIGYDLAFSESVHLAKGGVWDGVLLITLNYFLLYLMSKRIHFPMHTLAIAFDLAPVESLLLTWVYSVGWETGRGVGQCGTGCRNPLLGA